MSLQLLCQEGIKVGEMVLLIVVDQQVSILKLFFYGSEVYTVSWRIGVEFLFLGLSV